MKPKDPILNAALFGVLIGMGRWILECFFVAPLVRDPQATIWIMVSTITSVFIAVTIYPLALLAFRGMRSNTLLIKCLTAVPLIVLLGWYSMGFMELIRLRAALLDSANPNTPAERLSILTDVPHSLGYEVDNRIARNPNTPAGVLRKLHNRSGQTGTEAILAVNPNTPDDVLIDIARQNDFSTTIVSLLKKNPRYHEVFEIQKLDEVKAVEPEAK